MAFGRCVTPPGGTNVKKSKKVMSHKDLMNRIRKTLYYGGTTSTESDEKRISRSLAEFSSDQFSIPHKGHSLHRLPLEMAGSLSSTPCSLIMALIYLDRINLKDPVFVRRITPSELFIIAVMISTKLYAGYDEEIYLSDWAEDGNMTDERLKQLELEFLGAMEWNIYISNDEFFRKLVAVERTLAEREGLRRGWQNLTYTEVSQILPSFKLTKFMLNMLINNIAVMLVSYAAGVITIAGAFFLASQIPGHALHRKSPSSDGVPRAATVAAPPMTPSSLTPAPSRGMNRSCYSQSTRLTTTLTTNNATAEETAADERFEAACTALNVEAELLKLERQYREEAFQEDVRKRNNERSTTTYSGPLKGDLIKRTGRPQYAHKNKLEENWLTFKNEYSDKATRQEDVANRIPETPSDALMSGAIMKYVDDASNCTSSMFWHILIGAAHKSSILQAPSAWFKFM